MVQLMRLHPKTPSSLASFKSRLVFPFWYQLTQVILEKRPLHGCSSSSSYVGEFHVVDEFFVAFEQDKNKIVSLDFRVLI